MASRSEAQVDNPAAARERDYVDRPKTVFGHQVGNGKSSGEEDKQDAEAA
jgi:hypothetical protein